MVSSFRLDRSSGRLLASATRPNRIAAALATSIVVTAVTGTTASLAGPDEAESTSDSSKAPWTPLIVDSSLEAFRQLGGKAAYRLDDGGVVVGSTAPNTPNSFLATKETFGDFELEYEFLVDPAINSGVQIRSEVRPNGRVYGYQVEIDPSDRAWSAGIYDEARRGWLNPLRDRPAAQAAFRQNEWNKVRVRCYGDSLRTWIGGVPAADLVDSMTLQGFIALQVHSFKGPHPKDVRWRNLRVRRLGRHVWKSLFDGKSFGAWKPEGGGTWSIDDGVLIGRNVRSEAKHGHLFFDRELDDFTIRVEYLAVSGNSGLYFRTEKREGSVGIAGFQAEIDATKDAGGLYETHGRGWVVQPKAEFVKKHFRPGKWNEMTVSARGKRIVVHLNGQRSAELPADGGRRRGFVALQLHGGQDMEVQFRRIELLVPESEPARDSAERK